MKNGYAILTYSQIIAKMAICYDNCSAGERNCIDMVISDIYGVDSNFVNEDISNWFKDQKRNFS